MFDDKDKAKTVRSNRSRATRMRKEDRAELLLTAAITAFAEKGIGNAKHSDIAKSCGVSVATTFVYFPSRDELIFSVLEEVSRRLVDDVLLDALQGPSESRLRASALTLIDKATSHPELIKVWLMWSSLFEPAVRQAYQVFETRLLGLLAQAIPEAHQDFAKEEQARVALSAAMMLMQMVLSGEDPTKQQRFISYVIESLL